MRKRLIEKLTNKKKGSLGYTLTEMLVVVAIIAITCAIAIPSILSISRALRFAQANNYAKSIFLAAQQNLSELRSDGSLAPLQGDNVSAVAVARDHCGFPAEDWSDEYVYTGSDMLVESNQISAYDVVLPVNSVEATIRCEDVIIEYNPITGNVYAVFYCEDEDQQILNKYQNGTLPRDEEARRKLLVGYYDGSGLSSSDLDLERSQAEVEFTNGEEGIVTVKVPVPSHYYSKLDDFIKGLEVELTITGDNFGGTKTVTIKKSGVEDAAEDNVELDDQRTSVLIHYALDSLVDCGSFANLSAREENAEEGAAPIAAGVTYLSALTDSDFMAGSAVRNILPGDNVTIQADVTFINEDGDPAVSIRPGILAGVNPMFDYLLTSPLEPDKFTLAVANGRNLQNLNAIHPKVADCVKDVVLTDDIYWNATVEYYNEEYGSSGVYYNNNAEAPGRALPYFVPIQNENLFGTAEFIYMNGGTQSSGVQGFLESLLEAWLGSDFVRNDRVPTLTDELDTQEIDIDPGPEVKMAQVGDTHAKIDGQGYKVCFLNVDATRYEPCADTFYALGNNQSVDYYFAGLFGYVNTTINDLHVVNPIIKGHNFVDGTYMDPAAGALVGAAGYNVLITNCSTYLDTAMEGFNWVYGVRTAQKDYSAVEDMTWYGVSGQGAVGGLVGYAKSHRTVVGELNSGDTDYLAFSNCFAAVPVSGDMRGNTNKDYGYSNGVGGFIGNSQLTNFYNCYSSGNVRGTNDYHRYNNSQTDTFVTLLGLGGNGRTGMGIGGFVGTSHGTRYTNCFATGNVLNANGNDTTGGFVGMMCYDATKAYGHHNDANVNVVQHTVFDSTYAVGMCTDLNGNYLESFSGANGKIKTNYAALRAYYTGDYYELVAPHYTLYRTLPNYAEHYIFKDSYYLSQYGETGGDVETASSKCAKPITYDELIGLHNSYGEAYLPDCIGDNYVAGQSFINDKLHAIESTTLDGDDIQPLFWSIVRELLTGNVSNVSEVIDSIFNEGTFKVYFIIDSYRNSNNQLARIYADRIMEGFPAPPWDDATVASTHYYSEASAGKVYPFPVIKGLDYYGLWPEKTLDAGLAYYEVYSDGAVGYYFDREDTSTLKNQKDTMVVSDGYCIFTANVDDSISIYLNDSETAVVSGLQPDSTTPVPMQSIVSPESNAYYAVKLPWAVLNADLADGYYQKMKISIYNAAKGTKEVVVYFNPNVALSQVNSATQPTDMPRAISIRSARQLAALAGESTMWGEDYHYIQWLNINIDAYTAESFSAVEVNSTSDKSEVLDAIEAGGSIGNAEHPFLGTYDGSGYAETADIINFLPGSFDPETDSKLPSTTGIFGFIGEGGEVKNLDIVYNDEDALALGAENADNVGILAGINKGTISDVTMTLDQDATLTAKTNTGLLAACTQDGVLADCVLTVNEDVTLTALNAGLAIGASENAAISNVMVTQDDAGIFTVNADYAGGFAGSVVDSEASDVILNLNSVNAVADAVGGFAGYAEGTGDNTISGVVVNLKSALKNTKGVGEDGNAVYAAGFVGVSDTMNYSNVTVNAEDDIEASSAAGVFGTVNQGSIQNARANINKTVHGAAEAAGFAVKLQNGDYLVRMSDVNLTTSNSKIKSEGRAAGFAVEVGCVAMSNNVMLGSYDSNKNPQNTGIIEGGTEAAGYACSVSGEVSASHVRGSATITATNGTAAGFAVEVSNNVTNSGVTPAMGDSTNSYWLNSNDNLVICGANAAGFVANVANKNASVVNSYALGTVTQSDAAAADETGDSTENGEQTETPATAVAGFVLQNNGTVDGSTSNVNIVGGYGFAGTNNNLIQNCYSWYSDADANVYTPFAVAGDGQIVSSYFVDLDIPEEEDTEGTTVNTVVFYDYTGKVEEMLPSTLSGMVDKLNEPNVTPVEWFGPATYKARPYSRIRPATYPYPMLRQHFGNWVTKPQYAYGVMYYEKHKDADGDVQWLFNIQELTDPDSTIEKESLTLVHDDFTADLAATTTIDEAGYAIFCKSGVDPNSLFAGVKNWFDSQNPMETEESFKAQVYDVFLSNGNITNSSRYSFHKITELGDLIFESADTDGETRVVTWYANAIEVTGSSANPFLIRTAGQFAHVKQMPKAYFSQVCAIQTSEFSTIDVLAGGYNGNGRKLTVAEGNAWIAELKGVVQNVNLEVTGNVTAPVFGAVNGTLDLKAVNVTGSISQNAALIDAANGTVTSGNITVGQIDASASVVGAVNGGTVNVTEIKTLDVYGQIFGNVAAPVTVNNNDSTKLDITTGAVSGKLFGAISANVSIGDISVASASSGKVFESVTAGTTTLGDITIISGNADQLFGAISGGTVTGRTVEGRDEIGNIVTIPGNAGFISYKADTNQYETVTHLFASVSGGATLQNFNVKIGGSLASSLIGSVSGAVGEKITTVNHMDVDAALDATAFAGSGLMVNSLGEYTAVTDCNIESGTVTVTNLASYTVVEGEKQTVTYPFGGITGVVPANTVLTNNVVDADMNVFGCANKMTVVGGMAAISSGKIVRGEVETEITYTQDSEAVIGDDGEPTGEYLYDKARIGGLVGWMLPGAELKGAEIQNAENETEMDAVTAAGSINLLAEGDATAQPVTSGRDYVIGGAVAYDGGVATPNVVPADDPTLTRYSHVNTAVVVSENWAGCNLAQRNKLTGENAISLSAINPSGLGCVGKFVGYVKGGEFADCSATDVNTTYQFLGEIEAVVVTVVATDPESLYESENSSVADKNWGTEQPSDEALEEDGIYKLPQMSYTCCTYGADLERCTFGWTVETTADNGDKMKQAVLYNQTFSAMYIYTGTEDDREIYNAVNVGLPESGSDSETADNMDKVNEPKYFSIYWPSSSVNDAKTEYYIQIDGKFYPVYVDIEIQQNDSGDHGSPPGNGNTPPGSNNKYFYTLKYLKDNEFVTFKENVEVKHKDQKYDGTLYKKKDDDDSESKKNLSYAVGERYMIVTRDKQFALGLDGEKITFKETFDLLTDTEIARAVWEVVKIDTEDGERTRWLNFSTGSAKDTENQVPDQYLALRKHFWNDSEEGRYINIEYADIDSDNVIRYRVKGDRYLTYNTDNKIFGRDSGYDYSSGGYKFYIYKVITGGKMYVTEFDWQAESNSCIVTDSKGNEVELTSSIAAAAAVEAVTEETAETATEVTEAIEATEVVAEVDEAEVEATEAAAEAAAEATEPAEVSESTEATEPTEPTEAIESSEPTESTEPTEPTEPTSGEA